MRELGWIDGKTAQFVIRYYSHEAGNDSSVAKIAKELVAQKVDVFVVSDYAWRGTREATTTIPIVCMDMYDPVLEGASSSLARPSGNLTGVSWQSIDTAVKRVELAKDLMPNLKRSAQGGLGQFCRMRRIARCSLFVGLRYAHPTYIFV